MDKRKAAELVSAFDRLSNIDVIALLERDETKLLYAGEEGVVVDAGDGLAALTSFKEDFLPLISYIPPSSTLLCVHSEKLRAYLMENLGYTNDEGCYSYSWNKGPFRLKYSDFRTLIPKDFELVRKNYTLASDEEIVASLEEGRIYGLFVEEKIVGFIGFHAEGSMGMLTVFESERRKGYGEELEKFIINRALEMKIPAYCHVFFSNKASQHLQKKLGLSAGSSPCWWLWKD